MASGSENITPFPSRSNGGIAGGGGGPHDPSMDLLVYRLDQNERRTESLNGELTKISGSLTDIKAMLAVAPTKHTIAGWAIAIVLAVLGTGVAVGALLLQSSSNQLVAFQTGLTAVQTVVSAQPPAPLKRP